MTNTKTDHKNAKPTSTQHQAARRAAAAPERPTHASPAMIEACDRLDRKLDQVAGLVREQIATWKETRESAVPVPAPRETAPNLAVDTQRTGRVASANETPQKTQPARPVENHDTPQEGIAATPIVPLPTGPTPVATSQVGPAPAAESESEMEPDKGHRASVPDERNGQSMAALAEDARRLADTLTRSRNDWQEQSAGVQQALEAIMGFLESQAANVAPNVDVAGIMSRLRDLEEQQRTLQSQFNTNR